MRHKTRHPGVYYRLLRDGERRYEIAYTDSAGKYKFKTVPGGLKDAHLARAKIIEKMEMGLYWAPSKKTIDELADDYLEVLDHRVKANTMKDTTRVSYKGFIDAQVRPRVGHVKVSDLNVNHVARLVAEMGPNFSPHTIKNVFEAFVSDPAKPDVEPEID